MKITSLKKIITRTNTPVTPVVVAKKVAAKKVAVKKVVTKSVKSTVAKKSVSKKVAVKKSVSKKTSSARPLVVASDSESFWVTNGHVLNSLIALELAFQDMSTAVYQYHISSTGSDFADWVEAVLLAPECASELRKAKTAKAALSVVTKYLKGYAA